MSKILNAAYQYQSKCCVPMNNYVLHTNTILSALNQYSTKLKTRNDK